VFKSFKQEKGFALALVLLITTLVLITVLEFNYEMRVDASIATNFRDSLKALYVAKGGINAAIALLRQDTSDDWEKKKVLVDSLDEDWARPDLTWQVGEGMVTGMIIDEDRKVNLNEFLTEGGQGGTGTQKSGTGGKNETEDKQKVEVVRRILDKLKVNSNNTEEIIESIKDWFGEGDDNPVIESYYQSLPSPYEAKMAPFDDITEMLLVKGTNKNIFYQIKEKSLLPGGEQIPGSEKEVEEEPLKPLSTIFTVYTGPGTDKGKININTAPREVLLALHENMDEESVDQIIEHRTEEPFESVDEVKKISSNIEKIFDNDTKDTGLKGIRNLIKVRSNYFRIIAHGKVNDVTKTIEAVVFRDSNPEKEGRITIKSWAEY